jgi:anti-sigma factor RsiW
MTARMSWVGGHLGDRVSALLDGQLSADDEERAWEHVHTCHQCRDQVEREGWVKTRLAGLSFGGSVDLPGHLRGSLLDPSLELTPGEAYLVGADRDNRARRVGLVALGSGAAGAAVMGVLALGTAPADVPGPERRAPSTTVNTPSQPAVTGPSGRRLP